MLNNDPALESLVGGIQGTSKFLTGLISPKSGLVLFLMISIAIVLKVIF